MPTRKTIFWLITAALLYLIAWNIGTGWLYVIISILIAFPLGSIILSRANTRCLSIAFTSRERCVQGDDLETAITITNLSLLPKFLLDISCDFAGGGGSLLMELASGKSRRRVPLVIEDVRRGIYAGPRIGLSSRAPIGLARSRRLFEPTSPLVVYPRWHRLATDWDSGHRSAGYLTAGSLPTRTPSSDYLGVREYRPEDSHRSIHWKTTARTNRLAVTEYARHAAVTPVLVIDPYREADTGDCEAGSFEECVTIAASLIQREARYNRRFGIGASLEEAAREGLGHDVESAMLRLAGIEAAGEEPLDLDGPTLPWPEATPVIITTSHSAYAGIDRSRVFEDFPHAIVIMVDGRGFSHDRKAGRHLMDPGQLRALDGRLTAMGCGFMIIDSPGATASCLEDL